MNARSLAGGIVTLANMTRTGVFQYRQDDGSIRRELRPPEEVFAPESLATLAEAPLTMDHPGPVGEATAVTPATWRALAVGHVVGTPHKAGKFVRGEVIIEHGDAIDAVERGELQELSCRYEHDTDETSGVFEGEPYDAIQRNIRYNHVALVPAGRARGGPDVRIHLDGVAIAHARTATKKQERKPMERAMRYDEANEARRHAEQRAEGMAIILRGQLEAVGLGVPRGASPAFVEGMYAEAIRGGKIGPRPGGRADAPSVHTMSVTVADPFRLFAETVHTGRTDAHDGRTVEDTGNSANDARERMIARDRARSLVGRTDRDAARQRGLRRSTALAPSGVPQTPAGATEHMEPNSFQGNEGDNSGGMGDAEGMWDGAETRAAQERMAQRQRDAWKKTRAQR